MKYWKQIKLNYRKEFYLLKNYDILSYKYLFIVCK